MNRQRCPRFLPPKCWHCRSGPPRLALQDSFNWYVSERRYRKLILYCRAHLSPGNVEKGRAGVWSHPALQWSLTHAVTPVPCALVALVTDTLEGAGQVLAHGMGTAEGAVPALVHICKQQQQAVSVRPSPKLESPPHPAYRRDTHLGTRPRAWADSRGRRLACSGRSQVCSHSAGRRKWRSRMHDTRPHLPRVKEGPTGESEA